MNLRTKFAITTSATVLLTLATTWIFSSLLERRHLLTQLEAERSKTLEELIQICSDAWITHSDILLVRYIQTALKDPSIATIEWIDEKGSVLMHSDLVRKGTFKRSLPKKSISEMQELLSLKGPTQRFLSVGGKTIVDLASPLFFQKQPIGVIHISYEKSQIDALLNQRQKEAQARLLVVVLGCLGVGLMASFLLARNLTRPIQQFVRGVQKIGSGDLGTRLPIHRRDELGLLAQEFNAMALKLQELDRMKDDFISYASHELRNPLAVMQGYMDLLLAGKIAPEKEKETLQVMRENTRWLTRLVTDILDLTKLEAGRMPFRWELADLNPILQNAFDLFQLKAQELGVNLEMTCPPDLPLLSMDPDRIEQVLVNLLSNALKFTPARGRITISVENLKEEARLSVQDTGAGVPADKIHKVFSKFEQIHEQDPAHKVLSTGLGLSLSKLIVEAHGGKIGVESHPGQGSRFTFSIPKSRKDDPPQT
ncbi:MAG: HAMP domain-containing histidine kinase [Elusimicrobia bacterium]|nr:HAMP domain-containing histidine kinase [Elusimicrobiota bacterium]